jgi:antitoxin component YwqK of YwqJK toxin-antitoxin module
LQSSGELYFLQVFAKGARAMARYHAFKIVPLAACVMFSFDAPPAFSQELTPAVGNEPKTALLVAEPAGDPEAIDDYSNYGIAAASETADDATQSEQADEAGSKEVEVVRERYPNRTIKIEREVTQDAQGNYINHGSWKMWDERGTLVAEGHFKNGERDGTWNRWYRGGESDLLSKIPYQQFAAPFVSQAVFKNGKLDGKWTIYDSKQRKISEWEFTDGDRNGKSSWWFASGKKMREIDFDKGEINGEFNEWNVEGKQTIKDEYQHGRKLAMKTDYHNGGAKQKKSEGMYLYAKEIVQTPDDWWNAKIAVYTKQGKDEKHGKWNSWYPSGQKQIEGAYQNDLQVGKFIWWFDNGQVALEGAYENGKQIGPWVWWHQNGLKATHGEYADGNPTGRWRWWDTNGRVNETADLSHSEGKVVETPNVPAPSAASKNEALLPKPATPRVRSQFKR